MRIKMCIRDRAGGEQILSILERETHLVERIRLISKVIRVNLHSESNKYLIKYCTERILQTQGNIKVEELAEESGFTARHIGKMFERCVDVYKRQAEHCNGQAERPFWRRSQDRSSEDRI